MNKLNYILILSAAFAFSCGDNSSNENNGTDSGSSLSDMGSVGDLAEETHLDLGEKVLAFSDVETDVEKVVLREKGTKIFVVLNERRQMWTEIDNPDFVPFYTWPDTLPDALGVMSSDVSVGDERLWFIGESSENQASIYGAKHVPTTPGSKTFGDPVVIFDAGLGTEFSGVGIWQGVVAAGIRGSGDIKDKIVFAGPTVEETIIEVPGFHSTSSFRVASHGGVYAYDNSVWKISFEEKKVKRLTSTGKIRDVRTTDRSLFLKTDSGLGKLAVDCTEPCVPEKLTEGFAPQYWDANDELVAWNEGEVIRTFKDGKLSSVAKSNGPVLSVLVKNSDIYWATKDGLYVLK